MKVRSEQNLGDNSSLNPSRVLNHKHIYLLPFGLRCAHNRPVVTSINYFVDSMSSVLATVNACQYDQFSVFLFFI